MAPHPSRTTAPSDAAAGPAERARLARDAAGLEALPTVRAFVAEAVGARGADPATVDALVLAVDEVWTNVVQHGYGGRPGPLAVEVTTATLPDSAAPAVCVTVSDGAPPFDPTPLVSPALDAPCEDRPIGGLGWHLVRRSVDALRYARADGRNVVTLLRHLGAPPT